MVFALCISMLPAAVFAEDTGGSGMVAEMGGMDADKTHAVASGEFTVTPLRLSSGGGGGSTSGRFTVEFGANGGSGSTSGHFTVEFGANGGSKVASQTVPRNAAIKEPTAPTKEDFGFSGWYTDKELKTEYDFTAKVTSGFTFCAAWTEKEKSENRIILTIGEKDAYVFGVLKTNDVAPKIVNDRTMLPARFVAENPGAKVDRNGNGYFAKNIIIIS